MAVFGVEDPFPEFLSLLRVSYFRTLVGDVRVYVSVEKHVSAAGQRGFHSRCGTVTVLCKEKGHQLRVYGLIVTEVSAEETADKVSVYGSVVAWEMNIFE